MDLENNRLDSAEAMTLFELILNYEPEKWLDCKTLYRLGNISEINKDKKPVKVYYEKIIAQYPDTEEVSKAKEQFVVLNASQIKGIGMLMGRYRLAAIGGGRTGLYNVPKDIERILKMSNVCKLMKAYSNKQEALKELA